MKTFLEGLQWKPAWVSDLGCMQGCLNYLHIPVSWPWLFGATGHAFVINLHPKAICASGPTAWRFCERLDAVAPSLGSVLETVQGYKSEPDFAEKQQAAWDLARAALDAGNPCIGWELAIPEFYVVGGYDEIGYWFSGCQRDTPTGPKPWETLGKSGIGWLLMRAVRRADTPLPSPAEVVKDALAFSLEMARTGAGLTYDSYLQGPDAFEAWADALRDGRANAFGSSLNARVWAECRELAAPFLEEAHAAIPTLPSPLVSDAQAAYARVHERLRELCERYPFDPQLPRYETLQDSEAADLMRDAATWERRGLSALEALHAAL